MHIRKRKTYAFLQTAATSVFLICLFSNEVYGITQKLPGELGFASLVKRDSTKPAKPSTKNDTWFHSSEPEVRYAIDSSIINFEEFNPIYSNGPEYVNNGNFGGAVFPLVFRPAKSLQFNVGYNQFDLYRYTKDSIRYYQVVRPYTELQMVIGMRNEQYFKGTFANRHKDIIFYGLEFKRMFSKGIYANQRANDNGFYLYGIFQSKDKKWRVSTDLVFNSFKVQENGGVTDSVFEKLYLQKSLVPVLLSEAENNYRQTDFYLKGTRQFGKTISKRQNDSTLTREVVPAFSLSYQLNIEKNVFLFRDYDPQQDFYGQFYLKDSVFNTTDYLKVGNSLIADFNWRKITTDSTYEIKNLVAKAEFGYDHIFLNQNLIKRNFGNLYLSALVRSNFASGSRLLYNASVKYFIYGYNQHDLMADASAGYDLRKYGRIYAGFMYQQKEAPYIFENYTSHPAEWSYSFPKMQTISVTAKYQLPEYGIAVDFGYYDIKNMPVYAGVSNPFGTWSSPSQRIFSLHAANRNSVKGLHFDNDIWFTKPTEGYVKSVFPMLVTKHSIYYEARVFKQALWIGTGVDLRFRYFNNAPFYDPLLARFYPAFDTDKYTLRLDYFLNLKIRTVRIFAKVENILGAFRQLGHYSLYNYPTADIAFKGGLSWRFFE